MSLISFERISQCWFNSSKVSKIVRKLIKEIGSLKNYNASCFENTYLEKINHLFEHKFLIEKFSLIENTFSWFLNRTNDQAFRFRKKSEANLQAFGKKALLPSVGPAW